ncbi:hypothetical protein ACFVTP_32885 [Streptomyces celluloflavus]|uniref:hypothetical protein n=1 Tax=Streptomyces celluloflavus TaxID=58344 RepID=UPI0036DD1238
MAYFDDLTHAQQQGTIWRCTCHAENPPHYDVCHECRRPSWTCATCHTVIPEAHSECTRCGGTTSLDTLTADDEGDEDPELSYGEWVAEQIGPRQVGGHYDHGREGSEYEVLAIDRGSRSAWRTWQISVRWDRDGRTTSHCTGWDPDRDRVVAEPPAPGAQIISVGRLHGPAPEEDKAMSLPTLPHRDNSSQPAFNQLRSRLLTIGHCTADLQYQHMAVALDQALTTLADLAPAQAEKLADQLVAPDPYVPVSEIALRRAEEADIDTSSWSRRRAAADTLITHQTDPDSARDEAEGIWRALAAERPRTAAGLAELLTTLPDTWRQDLFPTDDITRLPAAPYGNWPRPEIATYDRDIENCGACEEVRDDFCRYHRGVLDSLQHMRELLATLATDDQALQLVDDRRVTRQQHVADILTESNADGPEPPRHS